ncbi:pentapeptide repeat-containing protein [Halarchaeum sp. P4]|uniref:pentapeptide repeat-containing protein n=1 Tax=Halarchaeum sp. P4 TaxID=3421639 RepID=UPI003EBAE7D4
MDGENVCAYTYVPGEDGPAEGGDAVEEEWSCPHDAHPDAERCVFHLSPAECAARDVSDAEVRDAFIEAIRATPDVYNEFVGAHFDTLDLSGRKLESGNSLPVNLRHATFAGRLRLRNAHVVDELVLSHSHLHGRFDFASARFENDLTAYDCTFDGVVKASTARFDRRVVFARSTFTYTAAFDNGAAFDEDAVFTGAHFASNAQFTGAHFDGRAFFRGAAFPDDARFRSAEFVDVASFADADFEGTADFRSTRFNAAVHFGDADIHSGYESARFAIEPTFADGVSEDAFDCAGVRFDAGADFQGFDFDGPADFDGATFGDDVTLTDVTCGGGFRFTPDSVTEDVRVVAERTHMENGTLGQPADGRVFYDFRDAYLGPVTVTGAEGDDTPAIAYMRFVTTTFDEFDFTGFRPYLEPEFDIHSFDVPTDIDPVELSPRDEEITYMKAKSGADEVGDDRCMSGFFVREMRARGKRFRAHARRADDPLERTTNVVHYGYNRAFDFLCRYAEDPHRLLGVLIGVIGVFGLLYWAGFALVAAPAPYTGAPAPLNFVLLSGEAFVAMVYPPVASMPTWVLRGVAVAESIVGALFISLFLFTLTRAVHR